MDQTPDPAGPGRCAYLVYPWDFQRSVPKAGETDRSLPDGNIPELPRPRKRHCRPERFADPGGPAVEGICPHGRRAPAVAVFLSTTIPGRTVCLAGRDGRRLTWADSSYATECSVCWGGLRGPLVLTSARLVLIVLPLAVHGDPWRDGISESARSGAPDGLGVLPGHYASTGLNQISFRNPLFDPDCCGLPCNHLCARFLWGGRENFHMKVGTTTSMISSGL